jgi:glycerate dehydrogenase
MPVHKIVFLDRAIFPAPLRRPNFPHDWVEYTATLDSEILERLRDATIVVSSKIPLRRATLERLPAIRFIGIAGTGYDAFDIDYCREKGIPIANVSGYAEHTVPEHTFALLLALRRNLFAYREDVQAGLWQQAKPFCLYTRPITDLQGGRIGIVGEGAIGQGTARIARGFGMEVVFADHDGPKTGPGPFVPLADLIGTADVVTLHCPLNARTRNLIGELQLQSMKQSAVLLNTARGGLVDETALVRALRERWIAGAGLDVLASEPPRSGNALLELRLPNLIVTPHIAWAGDRALATFAEQLIRNIEAWVEGRPQNLLN